MLLQTSIIQPVSAPYFDSQFGREVVKIKPGEYFATTRPYIIATVLGSCVAACIRDTVRGGAGMNHFMLPYQVGTLPSDLTDPRLLRYGVYAMESLIEQFVCHGSQRRDLEIKVFGGASVMTFTQGDVGKLNAAFVLDYLATEGLAATVSDLGGLFPRRIMQFVDTGVVYVKYLSRVVNHTIEKREAEYAAAVGR